MWNAEINRYAIDFAFCFRSAIHVIIHLIFIGTKTPQYDREVIEGSFWLQISFFSASCAREYETWKQCQWIMRTLTWKHKIWGKNFVTFEAPLPSLFSMSLKPWGYVNWWLISGLSSFFKKLLSGFKITVKFVGVNQIRYKNGKESKW